MRKKGTHPLTVPYRPPTSLSPLTLFITAPFVDYIFLFSCFLYPSLQYPDRHSLVLPSFLLARHSVASRKQRVGPRKRGRERSGLRLLIFPRHLSIFQKVHLIIRKEKKKKQKKENQTKRLLLLAPFLPTLRPVSHSQDLLFRNPLPVRIATPPQDDEEHHTRAESRSLPSSPLPSLSLHDSSPCGPPPPR